MFINGNCFRALPRQRPLTGNDGDVLYLHVLLVLGQRTREAIHRASSGTPSASEVISPQGQGTWPFISLSIVARIFICKRSWSNRKPGGPLFLMPQICPLRGKEAILGCLETLLLSLLFSQLLEELPCEARSLTPFFSVAASVSPVLPSVWTRSRAGSHIAAAVILRAYCTTNPLRDAADSFFISKPSFLSLSGFSFDFCLPVSKLTFDIYCLISSLISCFKEPKLNWILLKVRADAALNYFCFLR